MILEETINKLIRDTINLVLSVPGYAIKAKQNAPRPTGSYASVDFISDRNIGWEQHELVDNLIDLDITENISGLREITISIDFFRDSSIDYSRKVRTALVRQSVQELFSAAGVGLVKRTEVREISEPLENGWEERSQFDLTLSAVGTDLDIIKSIQSVEISGDAQFNGNSYNTIIEVP